MDKVIISNSKFTGMVIGGDVNAVTASDLTPQGCQLTTYFLKPRKK